ncbi:MAG: dephospho-CoA kinase [Hyphomicrobium sp.]|nr:dephospho-CoA kinase [Hyphomicrobium sp.]
MLVVGLTGSIGMGKSTAAAHLRAKGIPVFDADGEVHALYRGAAVPAIEAAFPGTTSEAGVDRAKLAAKLGGNAESFRRLDAIVHPLIRASERAFVADAHARGVAITVLEVPLIYETGLDRDLDAVVVLSAPPDMQRERVMARPGMTAERLGALLARQIPDSEKRRRADFVVDTSGPVEATRRQLDAIVCALESRTPHAFDRAWLHG